MRYCRIRIPLTARIGAAGHFAGIGIGTCGPGIASCRAVVGRDVGPELRASFQIDALQLVHFGSRGGRRCELIHDVGRQDKVPGLRVRIGPGVGAAAVPSVWANALGLVRDTCITASNYRFQA